MGNSISLVSKNLPLLDEVYQYNSRTAVLETPGNLVRETANAKTILIGKTSMQGLGNYSRSGGFAAGDITLEWESHTFSYDRGRSFQLDAMDDLESLGLVFASLVSEFMRTKVIPEVDAIRFAKYSTSAGFYSWHKQDTGGSTVGDIENAEANMKNNEVDLNGAYLFMTPFIYQTIKADTTHFQRTLVPSENPNRNFGMFDGMTVVEVPQSRFYTGITLNDGVTDGQKTGGYYKKTTQTTENFEGDGSTKVFTLAATTKPRAIDSVTVGGTEIVYGSGGYTYDRATGKITFSTAPVDDAAIVVKFGAGRDIRFMIIKPEAVLQITKHAKLRVFDPDTNQSGDGWKVDYRIYHDGWVLDNKTNGVYVNFD